MKAATKKPQVFILMDEPDYEHSKLLCPDCGDDYIHFAKPKIIKTDDHAGSNHVRGSVITVRCHGECGHKFKLLIGFHKGQTFIWSEPLPRSSRFKTV